MRTRLFIFTILFGIFGLYSCNNDDNSSIDNSLTDSIEGVWTWDGFGSYIFENGVAKDTITGSFSPDRELCMKKKKIEFSGGMFIENHLINFSSNCEFRTIKYPYEIKNTNEIHVSTGNNVRVYKFNFSKDELVLYYLYTKDTKNNVVIEEYDFDKYKRN